MTNTTINTDVNTQNNNAELIKEIKGLVMDIQKANTKPSDVVEALEDKLSIVTGAFVENRLQQRVAEVVDELQVVNGRQLSTIAGQADEITEAVLAKKKAELKVSKLEQELEFVSGLADKADEIKAELRKSEAAVNELEESLDTYKNSYDAVKKELKQVKSTMEASIAEQVEDYKAKHSTELRAIKLNVRRLERELEESNNENNELRKELKLNSNVFLNVFTKYFA